MEASVFSAIFFFFSFIYTTNEVEWAYSFILYLQLFTVQLFILPERRDVSWIFIKWLAADIYIVYVYGICKRYWRPRNNKMVNFWFIDEFYCPNSKIERGLYFIDKALHGFSVTLKLALVCQRIIKLELCI